MWRRELFARTAYFLQASSFINYKLTGGMTSDIGQAARTQCLDIKKMDWTVVAHSIVWFYLS